MNALDELLDHLFGDDEVGDHAVFHRPDGGDVAGRAAEHLLGGEADFLNDFLTIGPAFLADRDNGGFIKHDALAADINQRVRGAEIDGEIVVKVTTEETEHKAFRINGFCCLAGHRYDTLRSPCF